MEVSGLIRQSGNSRYTPATVEGQVQAYSPDPPTRPRMTKTKTVRKPSITILKCQNARNTILSTHVMSCYSSCYSTYDTMLHIPHFHNYYIAITSLLRSMIYALHTTLHTLCCTYYTTQTLHSLPHAYHTCYAVQPVLQNAILHTTYAILLNVPQCTYSITHTLQNMNTLLYMLLCAN